MKKTETDKLFDALSVQQQLAALDLLDALGAGAGLKVEYAEHGSWKGQTLSYCVDEALSNNPPWGDRDEDFQEFLDENHMTKYGYKTGADVLEEIMQETLTFLITQIKERT